MLLIKSEQYNIIIGYGFDKPYNTHKNVLWVSTVHAVSEKGYVICKNVVRVIRFI